MRVALAGQVLNYGVAKAIPVQMPYPSLTRLLQPFGTFSGSLPGGPELAEGYRSRGDLSWARSDVQAAWADYDQALTLQPADAKAWFGRGRAWAARKDAAKALSDFQISQTDATDGAFPRRFRALDGKRVQLTGEMWSPLSAGDRLRDFQLCYSLASCCFNGPPKIQHFVRATVPAGRDVRFAPGRVTVSGTFHVGVVRADGAVQSIYRIDVDTATSQ